jgi:hypothetical protein
MFERLVVRRQNSVDAPNPIDLGFLAEAMLFYGDVALVANRLVIQQLLRACGPDTLLALLHEGHLRLLVSENYTVINTQNAGTPRERYDAGLAEIRRSPHDPPISIEGAIVVDDFIAATGGRQGRGRRLALQAAKAASVTRIDPRVAQQTHLDLRDPSFVSAAALDVLQILAPGYEPPPDGFFYLDDDGSGSLALRTNIDFRRANDSYRLLVPAEHSTLGPAHVLGLIMSSREAVDGAAALESELACDPANARIIQRRVTGLIERRARSEGQKEHFVEWALNDGRAIRDAVNSGARSFEDVLKLLNRARDFRGWLHSKPADVDLVKEYFKAATRDTWADSLPTKVIRWFVMTIAAGTQLGPIAGAAVGTVDAFLVDRLIKGYRPNQFVNGPLKRFVG